MLRQSRAQQGSTHKNSEPSRRTVAVAVSGDTSALCLLSFEVLLVVVVVIIVIVVVVVMVGLIVKYTREYRVEQIELRNPERAYQICSDPAFLYRLQS